MFGRWLKNARHWADTTSIHGPAEITTGQPLICNIFWAIVVAVMTAIAVIVNYATVLNYAEKTPIMNVEFENFDNLEQKLDFYKMVYCSTSFLNITKLIADRIQYASVVYLLLLMEGDTLTEKEPIDLQFLPEHDDNKLKTLRNDPNSMKTAAANFGGGLVNFMTVPIEVDSTGKMIGFKDRSCEICDDKVDKNCLTTFVQRKSVEFLRQANMLSAVSFREYLKSKGFPSVQDFILHYAVDFQSDFDEAESPVYTIRFRRLCQLASARPADGKTLDTSTKLYYEMVHDINHLSPCNVHRRAISYYTGLNLLEDSVNSFPFLEDIAATDQALLMTGQKVTTTFFKMQPTRYSSLQRPKNMCFKNERIDEKYPFFVDFHFDCVERCLRRLYTSSCLSRLMLAQPDYQNYYCPEIMTWPDSPSIGKSDDDTFVSMDEQIACSSSCDNLKAGLCTTYAIQTSLEKTEIQANSNPDAVNRFVDLMFLRTTKTVMSFNEYPQYNFGAVISQVGGNLGLFLGASWVSFIHMFAICCCYTRCFEKKTTPKPTFIPQTIDELY